MKQKRLLRFEVMDRASIQLTQLSAALEGHMGLTKRTRAALKKAIDATSNLYQVASEEFIGKDTP
jgi:hypothetical protein